MKISLVGLILLLGSYGFAQVPGTLSYQGILMQSDGITPINDDTYGVQFNFYNSGGTLLGGVSARTINVTSTKGLFTCIIGGASGSNAPFSTSEITAISAQKTLLGIRVDVNKNLSFEETELSPRAELTPAVYAFQAQSINNTNNPTGGNVSFWGANNTLSSDASLFWDNSVNKRLGIGTSSPGSRLHVVTPSSSSATDGILVEGSINNELNVEIKNTFTNGARLFMSAYPGYSKIQTDKDLIFATSGSWIERMRITSGGFIGINNPSPGFRLDMLGSDFKMQSGTTSLHFRTDGGNSFINNINNFVTNGSSANGVLHIDGQLGLRLGAGNFGTQFLNITTGGNVGIGTISPGYKLEVNGDISLSNSSSKRLVFNSQNYIGFDIGTGQIYAESPVGFIPGSDNTTILGSASYRWQEVWSVDGSVNTSDSRLKENVVTLKYGLSEILKLRPVAFTWKSNPERGVKLGLIAQDVGTVLPEVVIRPESEEEFLGLAYDQITPVLITAIKEQQGQIEELKSELSEFRSELAELKKLLTRQSESNGSTGLNKP